MTYKEAYEKAEEKLEKGEITCGEFDELTKPLDEEIRPHGEWKGTSELNEVFTRICTSCDTRSAMGHFCMWCGADMRKKEVKEIPLEIEETIKNDTQEFFQSIGKYMKEVKSK